MAFNNTVVGRAAASIWGLKLGNATMNAVLAQANVSGLNSVLNQAFNTAFSSYTNDVLAAAFVNNLGLTGQAAIDGRAYTIDRLNAVGNTVRGETLLEIANLFSSLTTDALYGAFATQFNAKVAAAVDFSSLPGTTDTIISSLDTSTSFFLRTSQDNITGTAGNDVINAYVFDNQNTLQSGDFVDGGAGNDLLYADMGSSQNFAVTPITRNVETIAVRAQSRATDSGDNNLNNEGRVIIDAERIEGELRYESNNSRADLIIEDVRIAPAQITKNITVAMVQTDPGNVDYGLYFDQHSLRASSQSSASLTLQLLDQKAAVEGAAPLRDSPYDGFRFQLNGEFIQFTSPAFNAAQTYAELLTAVQAFLATDPRTNGGKVTAALGSSFSVVASGGQTVTGTSIVLSATNATFGAGTWIALAGVPAESNLYTNQFTGVSTSNDLVTSTIHLDDVGRGSNGGDLIVGGLSVGETSESAGVDRFEITVDRTSRLQNIASTNGWLKEVTVKNGVANGALHVSGNVANGAQNNTDGALPGFATQHDDYGFNDVRLIDASAMNGAISFDALVSAASFGKYVMLTDTQSAPSGDNGSTPGQVPQRADFIYSGGAGNDSITVDIEQGVAGSHSTVLAGREDFTFTVNGGAGDDAINVRIIGTGNPGANGNWYQHQHYLKNIAINAGDGNDTVRKPGAGDVAYALGAGADTLYADNSGAQAGLVASTGAITNVNASSNAGAAAENGIFVFNTVDQSGALAAARNRNDLLSSSNSQVGNNGATPATESLYRATITVTFLGLTSQVQLPADVFTPTDLHMNQAIKAAINGSPVLSKLLVAEDGPGYTLVVKSLIDGVRAAGDLTIAATAVDVTNISAVTDAQVQSLYAALVGGAFPGAVAARPQLATLLNDGAAYFNGAAVDYDTALANDGAADVTGAISTATSDNVINPGAGNDVIVLGTKLGAVGPVGNVEFDASNDRIVYNALDFGSDVIVNFVTNDAAGDVGGDKLDFRGIGAGAGGFNVAAPGGNGVGGRITVVLETNANDTAAEIAALYTNDAANTTARTWVVVTYSGADNSIGKVYQLVDGALTAGVTATLAGTIDLANVGWNSLDGDDFF